MISRINHTFNNSPILWQRNIKKSVWRFTISRIKNDKRRKNISLKEKYPLGKY